MAMGVESHRERSARRWGTGHVRSAAPNQDAPFCRDRGQRMGVTAENRAAEEEAVRLLERPSAPTAEEAPVAAGDAGLPSGFRRAGVVCGAVGIGLSVLAL